MARLSILCITLGLALILSGISWMCLFGCAITLSTLLFGGRLAPRPPFNTWINYSGLCVSLGGGVYQLATAWQHGFLWLRVPPKWWFVLWISGVWVSLILKEFLPSRPAGAGWQPGASWQVLLRPRIIRRLKAAPSAQQARLRPWIIRSLKVMPPEQREKFLAHFDQQTVESYRKEIKTGS